MTNSSPPQSRGFTGRFLDFVEAVGNKLPHPTILFIYLILAILGTAAILSAFGVVVETPTGQFPINNLIGNGEVVLQNPRTGDVAATYSSGWTYIAETMTTNFVTFAPFGLVVVIMLAIGVAEHGGLIGAAIRKLVRSVPARLVTPTVIFAGVMANVAADAGYFVLIPLGPIVFYSMGRHPLAGLAAAFAGVSGGFSANLLITPLEPLLGGFTQSAAGIGDALVGTNYSETLNIATMNYYFVMVSTLLVVLVGTYVIDRIIEPRLGGYTPTEHEAATSHEGELSPGESRALRHAGWATFGYAVLVAAMAMPVDSNIPLVGVLSTAALSPEAVASIEATFGSVGFTHSPLFGTHTITTVLFFLFLIPGLVYGYGSGAFTSGNDVVKAMETATYAMVPFIVMVFFMAQFIAYFNASNVGILIAMQGASLLELMPRDSNIGLALLIFGFVFLSGFINLFMGSASAKWAILAPIFVPVLMTVDITPAATQMLYRIGDSSTNIITPLMAYFGFIITVGAKYRPGFGIGSLSALMLPMSIALMLSWTVLFILWALAGLPIGPDTPVFFYQG